MTRCFDDAYYMGSFNQSLRKLTLQAKARMLTQDSWLDFMLKRVGLFITYDPEPDYETAMMAHDEGTKMLRAIENADDRRERAELHEQAHKDAAYWGTYDYCYWAGFYGDPNPVHPSVR